jgi:serine/threonine protein kinase
MQSLTEPVSRQPGRAADSTSANEWLDSFASGACDQDTFLRAVGELLENDADAGWELLARIDQYFRRGKIDAAAFATLKAHLQNLLMRPGAVHAVSTAASVVAQTARPQAERTLAPGDVLRGRYRIVALLGQGGMGTVFEAIDEFRVDGSRGDQRVAIKVLHSAVIRRPHLFAELRREFQYLQSLSHPNIVRVHEFDRDGDVAFFTMELLSGALLTRVIGAHLSAPMHRSYAFAIIRDVGSAIAHAHGRGIAHGDLNPGNIFITDAGEVRVLDFGASHDLRSTPWNSEFNETNQIAVATRGYASCQLLEGENADVRDDVYALACIAYVLLTGKHPFREHSALQARTLRLKPDRPTGLGRLQWNALRAGLQFERDRRPGDVGEWMRQLEPASAASHLPALPALLSVRQPHRGRASRVAFLGAILVAACVGWAVTHQDALKKALTAAARDWNLASPAAMPAPPKTPITGAPRPRPMHPSVAAKASVPPPEPAVSPEAPMTNPAPAKEANRAPPTAKPEQPLTAATAAAAPSAASSVPVANPIHARLELAADTVDVAPSEPMAHVVVKRTRSLRGDVTFLWWTESGTAKPGRDFKAVASQIEHIEDGKNEVNLFIPLITAPGRHDARSFYVVIDAPSDNAALGQRTLSMVTLPETQ